MKMYNKLEHGIGMRKNKMGKKIYIAMYHYIRDLKHSRYPKIKALDFPLFKQQLEYIKNNFKVITMEQLIDVVENNNELSENTLLLTFDDGYIDNYTYVMPLLEEYGMQGSFFIPGKTFATHQLLDVNKIHYILASANIYKLLEDIKRLMDHYRGIEFDYASTEELFSEYAIVNRFDSKETVFIKRMLQTVLPERLRNRISSELFEKYVGVSEEQLAYELYLTEDQIRTMKRHGMYIGLHGYDHYWLANLELEQMKKDIDMALNVLDEFIDRKQWVLNYPYGNCNDEVINYIKLKGACLGMTTEVRIAQIGKDDRFRLPRLDCNDFPPKSEKYKNFG